MAWDLPDRVGGERSNCCSAARWEVEMKLIRMYRKVLRGGFRSATVLWETDEGTFTTKELANYFDCSESKIRSDFNKYGFDPDRFSVKAIGGGKKGVNNHEFGSWGELPKRSKAEQERNLMKIKGPGLFERGEYNERPEDDRQV